VKAKKTYKAGGKIDPPSKASVLNAIKAKQKNKGSLEGVRNMRSRLELDGALKSGKINESQYKEYVKKMEKAQGELANKRAANSKAKLEEASKGYDNIMNFVNDRKK
jgi:sRNA-binding protein